jgi:MtN3 and saliva related transmembrane protein
VPVATMIGLLAGSMTTAAWLPQVAKAFRTKSTRDFSWSWFALFGFGVALWLVYGLAVGAIAVILPNALTFLLILGLFLLKLAHSGTEDAEVESGDEAEAGSEAGLQVEPWPEARAEPWTEVRAEARTEAQNEPHAPAQAPGVLAGVGAGRR